MNALTSALADPASTLVTLLALLVVGRLIAPFVDLRPVAASRSSRTGSVVVTTAGRQRVRSSRVLLGVVLAPVPSSA